jgi:ABC-type multidrug transport system ATPase subunit
VVIINKGKVVAVDSLDNLISAKSDKTFIRIGGDQQAISNGLAQLENVISVEHGEGESKNEGGFIVAFDDEKQGSKRIHAMIEKNDWNIEEMRPVETNLEDIFIQLVSKEGK